MSMVFQNGFLKYSTLSWGSGYKMLAFLLFQLYVFLLGDLWTIVVSFLSGQNWCENDWGPEPLASPLVRSPVAQWWGHTIASHSCIQSSRSTSSSSINSSSSSSSSRHRRRGSDASPSKEWWTCIQFLPASATVMDSIPSTPLLPAAQKMDVERKGSKTRSV